MQNFIHVDDQSKEKALNAVVAQVNARGAYSTVYGDTPLTLRAARMVGASIVNVNLTAPLSGDGTLTTDTAAAIIAAMASYAVGETFSLRIINSSTSAYAWMVRGGTGVTVNGAATIAQHAWREFLVTISSATAVTLQNVGGGTA